MNREQPRKHSHDRRFGFPQSLLGPRSLFGPLMFVLVPAMFYSTWAHGGYRGGEVFLLSPVIYLANWLWMIPRRLEIGPDELVLRYWLRRRRIAAADVTAARVVHSEEMTHPWGILLTNRLWNGVTVEGEGNVRIVATEDCLFYALIETRGGAKLLIGCDYPMDAVHAIRTVAPRAHYATCTWDPQTDDTDGEGE